MALGAGSTQISLEETGPSEAMQSHAEPCKAMQGKGLYNVLGNYYELFR